MPKNPNTQSSRKEPFMDVKAKPIKTRSVINRKVVKITDGLYRGASLSGHFELKNQNSFVRKGKTRLLVNFSWFGVSPTKWRPSIIIDGATVEEIPSYSGDVVDVVAREDYLTRA